LKEMGSFMSAIENRTDEVGRIDADLRRLDNTLDLLANDYRTNCITEIFYQRRKGKEIEAREAVVGRLQDFLSGTGAGEVAELVGKIKANASDKEIEEQLKKVEEQGLGRNWGRIVSDIIEQQRGSVVKISLKVALAVARFLEPA
jgi:hypothetical protein